MSPLSSIYGLIYFYKLTIEGALFRATWLPLGPVS